MKGASSPTFVGCQQASPLEGRDMMAHARLVDVREPQEFFGSDGHVAGAELVPLGTLERVASGWTRDEPLIVICRSGTRSARAAALLRELGFRRVTNLVGGMQAWQALGLPVEVS